MLSVIILNVVILIAVAPRKSCFTDGIDAADFEHPNFGDRFEVGSAEHRVNALVEPGLNAHVGSDLVAVLESFFFFVTDEQVK